MTRRAPSRRRAFTLMELLIVIGLIAGMTYLLARSIGGGSANALQSGQAQIANLVTAARMKSAATGRRTRLLFHMDLSNNPDNRFLQFVVLQVGSDNTPSPAFWTTVNSAFLPDGVYVVPASLTMFANLVSDSQAWKKTSAQTEDLVSDALAQTSLIAIEGDGVAQTWAGFMFTPNGTLASISGGPPPKGMIVVALGALRPPSAFNAGESTILLRGPEYVRGVALSAYGIPALLNERTSF